MISIIMPVFNGQKFLKEQIYSIVNQIGGYTMELIFINDCSEDDSKDIIVSFCNKYENFIFYDNEKNLGVNYSFEFGIRRAKYDIIMLSDQDDIWFPNKIEKMYSELSKNCVDLVGCLSYKMKGETKTFDIYNPEPTSGVESFMFNRIRGASMMINKNFCLEALPFLEEVLYDKWLYFYALALDKLQILEYPLDYYRIHDNNVVGDRFNMKNSQKLISSIELNKNMFETLKERTQDEISINVINSLSNVLFFNNLILNVLRNKKNIFQFILFLMRLNLPLRVKIIYLTYIFR